MSRILILDSGYDSQTIAISLRMAELLQKHGYVVDTVALHEMKTLSLEQYDGVLIGNSVNWGISNPQIKDWVKRHRNELQSHAVGLFMMSSSSKKEPNQTTKSDRKVVESFVRSTGWYPTIHAFFGNTFSFFRKEPQASMPDRESVESFIEDFIIELKVRTEESYGYAMVGDI